MHPTMTIDTGNTGFMLLCTSLVMLMTPGLAFFYGGLVGRKNVLSDHDAVLRQHGLDDGIAVVRVRIFALLFQAMSAASLGTSTWRSCMAWI